MLDKDRIVKGCRSNNTYNWYIGSIIRSSFWKFQPYIFLWKRLKILDEYFFELLKLESATDFRSGFAEPCRAALRAMVLTPMIDNNCIARIIMFRPIQQLFSFNLVQMCYSKRWNTFARLCRVTHLNSSR